MSEIQDLDELMEIVDSLCTALNRSVRLEPGVKRTIASVADRAQRLRQRRDYQQRDDEMTPNEEIT